MYQLIIIILLILLVYVLYELNKPVKTNKSINQETNKQVNQETNKQVDLETKDKIIQSFLFGYRYNILVKGKNKDKLSVDISKDSTLYNAKNSTFFYLQLSKISGNYQAQIVSAIPQKMSQKYIKILSI